MIINFIIFVVKKSRRICQAFFKGVSYNDTWTFCQAGKILEVCRISILARKADLKIYTGNLFRAHKGHKVYNFIISCKLDCLQGALNHLESSSTGKTERKVLTVTRQKFINNFIRYVINCRVLILPNCEMAGL